MLKQSLIVLCAMALPVFGSATTLPGLVAKGSGRGGGEESPALQAQQKEYTETHPPAPPPPVPPPKGLRGDTNGRPNTVQDYQGFHPGPTPRNAPGPDYGGPLGNVEW